ncbi:MAG: ribonuclease E/G [Saprospiraceae bacterium]|nr:ribonuclease E/G [Saprospiraceae bacterium]
MKDLTDKWEKIYDEPGHAASHKNYCPNSTKTSSILRDVLSGNFTKIVVNSKEMHDSIRDYLKSIAPERVKILHWHKGNKPIFDQFEITRQIKSSLQNGHPLCGSHIVIEQTEAMHVVDVNPGPKNDEKRPG